MQAILKNCGWVIAKRAFSADLPMQSKVAEELQAQLPIHLLVVLVLDSLGRHSSTDFACSSLSIVPPHFMYSNAPNYTVGYGTILQIVSAGVVVHNSNSHRKQRNESHGLHTQLWKRRFEKPVGKMHLLHNLYAY